MDHFTKRSTGAAATRHVARDSLGPILRAIRIGRRWPCSGSNRLGAAATEFAIVAPLFILLVIGMIELGRGLMVQQVLINASRVGARQAITMGATGAEVQTAVTEYAASVAVPNVTAAVSPDPAGAPAGTMISVTTTVPFNDVSWLPAPWFLGGATLTAESNMRKEGFE